MYCIAVMLCTKALCTNHFCFLSNYVKPHSAITSNEVWYIAVESIAHETNVYVNPIKIILNSTAEVLSHVEIKKVFSIAVSFCTYKVHSYSINGA